VHAQLRFQYLPRRLGNDDTGALKQGPCSLLIGIQRPPLRKLPPGLPFLLFLFLLLSPLSSPLPLPLSPRSSVVHYGLYGKMVMTGVSQMDQLSECSGSLKGDNAAKRILEEVSLVWGRLGRGMHINSHIVTRLDVAAVGQLAEPPEGILPATKVACARHVECRER